MARPRRRNESNRPAKAWVAGNGTDGVAPYNPKTADGAALAKDGSGWTNLELYLADIAKVRR